MNDDHRRYIDFLENLTPESLEQLGDFVTGDIRFRDPFNDVRGADRMHAVFRHMFAAVGPVTLKVCQGASDGNVLYLQWVFSAQLRGHPWSFDGTSVVTFASSGLVEEHIDYWDAATAFYERLPVIGWLLRRVRRRVACG